jgi:hypothetical protein
MIDEKQEKRIYKNYHTVRKVAEYQLLDERYPDGMPAVYADDEPLVTWDEIRQRALELTAARYKVTVDEVSKIVWKLRNPDPKPKNRQAVLEKPKKRVHKR